MVSPKVYRSLRRASAAVIAAFLTTMTLGGVATAQSSNPYEVVARVNNSIITGYDVSQRTRLIEFGAGKKLSSASTIALEELIVDELKLQEAQKRGFKMSDDELADSLGNVAKNNGISLDQFLAAMKRAGVERETFEKKLKSDVLWRQVLQRRYGQRMRPSDGEVDAELETASKATETIYDVKQIVVPVGPNAARSKVRAAFEEAVRVKRQLTGCDKLPALAKKYGKPSGDVGKLTAAQMPGPIRAAVTKLKPNGATDPLRTQSGVHVIMLCGKAEGSSANRKEIENRLRQLKAVKFSDSYIEELRRSALITQ